MRFSTNGGAQVRWRRDGKELFYIALDDRLMAVPIGSLPTAGARSRRARSAVPHAMGGAMPTSIDRQQYMVSSDGQRFLMNTVTEEAVSPITVILNWKHPTK